MFAKDTKFAFERTRPHHFGPARYWTGDGWREDRRTARDPRLGRRKSDAYFPYNPCFVVQALAQSEKRQGEQRESTPRYRGETPSALSGRFVKLLV